MFVLTSDMFVDILPGAYPLLLLLMIFRLLQTFPHELLHVRHFPYELLVGTGFWKRLDASRSVKTHPGKRSRARGPRPLQQHSQLGLHP